MSTRTEGYGGTGGVQYPVRQPVTTPTIIEPKKDYSAHEYTVQGKGTLSNLGKDTLLKEANSATGNFQAKSLRDSQNLQGVSNTANHVTENILHSNHANNTVPLHGEKKLSSEMEELQSKKQGIERELTKIENKLQIRSNPQLLKTQEKLLNELSSLSLQELTLSMEESKDKADDIAQSKFHQVTNTNAERTNSIFTTRKANITSSKSATSASYTNITTSSSTSKTRTESLAKNLQHKEVPHEGLQIRHISTMTTKTAELTDPVTINKANVVKKFLVLERQQRYEAPVNKEKADQLKQDRESKIKALFENFPAEAKSGLNNTAAPSSEVAYLQEFMKENEAVLNKHSEIKGYANQIIANDQNQKLIPEVKAKLVEVIEALVVHQLDVDAQNMKTEKGPLPLMSVNDFAKLLFHPPSNKENINNFLVANRDLKTQLLLADDKNTLKFEEGKPTKVINAQNGEMTVDRNSSLFIFLKATFEKPETSLYEKQQILNIAEQWLKDPFINSYHVSEMEQYIGDLIGLAQAEKSPLLKTAGENLIDSFKRASAVEKPDLKFEGIHDVNVLMKSLRAGELKKGKENYQKAVKDFAGSIRGQNSKQYQAITSEEFNNQIWTKKDAQINAPNIAMNTKIFNKLTEFTIDSILDTDSFPDIDLSDEKNKDTPLAEKGVKTRLKEAGRVAEFYGDVLNELLSSENGFVDFNGSMAIQQGLKSGAIKRLPLDLSKEVKKNIVDFETLTNPGSSNKNLRDKYNELDKNKISYIPYQGMFLTDVTFTIEGNKTNHEHEINPNMVKGLGTVINGVKTRQRDLKKEEFTQGNVFNMQSINERKTSDDRQYDISELLVPRESKDKKTKK